MLRNFLLALLCSAMTASAADVTFTKHVAPIVFKNCAGCHRPGEVAPFSLLTYRDVAKRAEQIRDITARHAMPPWKPLTGFGEFSNGRRLTDAEITTISDWVAGGAREGDAADLPEQPKFAAGWQLGEPDMIVKMPDAVDVPSDGRDVYLNIVLPVKIPAGKYLKAAEYRPGNRRVVHHAVLFYDTKGECRKRDEAEAGPGFQAITPPAELLPGAISIWVPGRFPVRLPEGISLAWADNADLVLNLHLHPSGKPETEQSTIGLYLTDEAPKRSLSRIMLIDKKIDIPPGEKSFRTTATREVPADVDLLSIFPHMHMIGKEVKITATSPDGSSRVLFWINDWDFNWQDLYEYKQPIRLVKGTKITMEGIHDNSAENPANPRHPPERVTFGEQTFNEMSIAFLEAVPVRPGDIIGGKGEGMKADDKKPEKNPPQSPPVDYTARAKEALRKFDKDADDHLSLDELLTAVGKSQSPADLEKRLGQFDKDANKKLDLAELMEAIKAQGK